ncbi:hypothetical protein LXA43DRAFT_1026099 [Ganoderma leucocontextum]|nr:hypothetical protein LXA43DRAFT_1026099 [Ganoderma leucocontextum]
MASPTVLHVNLALTCVESLLYGIFFVLAIISLAVLVARRWKNPNGTSLSSVGGPLSSPLVIGTVLLLITVSGHWCTTVLRLFQSMDYEGGQHMGDYYLMVELTPQVVATAFVVASVVVGDIILVCAASNSLSHAFLTHHVLVETYRAWIVWDRKFATVIFPTLCTCAYIGAGISVVQLFAVFKPEESIFVLASKRRVITTAALTLSTNMYGTGCIAYRIWSTNRTIKHKRASGSGLGLDLSEALVIFVESAALYTAWTFFFLVSYIVSSPLEAFAFHCIPAATGISFMLIIVRVGLGFSWAEPAVSQLGVAGLGPLSGMQTRGQSDSVAAYPLTMISLNVTRTVERETATDFALPRAGTTKGDADSDTAGDPGELV